MIFLSQHPFLFMLLSLCAGYTLSPYLSPSWMVWPYTFSVIFKEILLFILPAIMIIYIASALAHFAQKSTKTFFFFLIMMMSSNIFMISLSSILALLLIHQHIIASLDLSVVSSIASSLQTAPTQTLEPLFHWPLKNSLTSHHALLMGVLIGLVAGNTAYYRQLNTLKNYTTHCLSQYFLPCVPFYIFGFALQLGLDNHILTLLTENKVLFLIDFSFIFLYILSMYILAAGGSLKTTCLYIRHMLPAGLSGFTTLSSLMSMPLTLLATERNSGDKALADLAIPFTVNNHLVAATLNTPLLALTLLFLLSGQILTWPQLCSFIFYYSVLKFSTVAIPGGNVLILIPFLERQLDFPAHGSTLLTALFFLQEPFLTAGNVMGNGAFALICSKVQARLRS